METKSRLDRIAHPLSVLAAQVVRDMIDKPGIWDFERAFEPKIALMDLQSRAAEVELAANSETAQLARQLYFFHRGVELRNAIAAIEKKLKP